MKRTIRRVAATAWLTLLLCAGSALATSGSGDVGSVATAVENTWSTAAEQIKTVVNNVVFPALDLILTILLFVKVATVYLEYRKHGQLEWTAPVILFVCLIFTLTAPAYIWSIVGL